MDIPASYVSLPEGRCYLQGKYVIFHRDLLASPGMIQPKTSVRCSPPLRLDTGGNVLMLTVWRGSKHVNGAVHGILVKTVTPVN